MSQILDIDVGNSRTKWRCGDVRGVLPTPRLPKVGIPLARVRICTVAGNHEEIAKHVNEHYGLNAEFARTEKQLLRVTNAYEQASRLGTDRWLAVVAAWNRYQSRCVVVDAGSALTVDFLGADAKHLGGFIVPGLQMMRNALCLSTRDVEVAENLGDVAISMSATTTESAVNIGTLQMLIDFVEACVSRLEVSEDDYWKVVLTGGDAEQISAHLSVPHSVVADLVLDGLALALP